MEIIIDTGIKYTHKVKPKEWEIEFINIEKEKNMEEKIKELEKQIAELKAELKKEKEDNDFADDCLYELGNYFKTEEEAKTMAKKLKAIAKVSRAILIANGDWKPDMKTKKIAEQIMEDYEEELRIILE